MHRYESGVSELKIRLLRVSVCPWLLLFSAVCTAQQTTQNTSPDMAITGFHFLKTLLALALVLAVFFILARIARQMKDAYGVGSDTLSVVSALSVGVREKLLIVRAGGTHVLIGVGPAGIVKLGELAGDFNPAEAKDTDTAVSGSFATRFQQALGRGVGK